MSLEQCTKVRQLSIQIIFWFIFHQKNMLSMLQVLRCLENCKFTIIFLGWKVVRATRILTIHTPRDLSWFQIHKQVSHLIREVSFQCSLGPQAGPHRKILCKSDSTDSLKLPELNKNPLDAVSLFFISLVHNGIQCTSILKEDMTNFVVLYHLCPV